tara:strand:+ start:391 stop:750 length:360 start_codon:yes stop_codon:yes gene_type:complete
MLSLIIQMTCNQATGLRFLKRRFKLGTDFHGMLATGSETAAGRWGNGTRRVSSKRRLCTSLPWVHCGDRAQKRLGVGMKGIIIKLVGFGQFNYLPKIHHRYAVRQISHYMKVMGDEDVG